LLSGDIAAVLQTLQNLYVNGATPMLVLQDLIEITHLIAKVKVLPDFINDASLSETDRELCKKLSGAPISILSKIWQMLIKGLSELQYATVQIDALEMILMRIAYSAALPTPAALLEELKKKSSLKNNNASMGADGTTAEAAATGVVINTTDDLVQLMTAKKVPMLMFAIKNDISFKSFEFGHIHIAVSEKAEKDLIYNFRAFLEKETGISWKIDIDYEPLGETLAFIEARELNRDKKNISEYPLVKAILNEFNGAKIETIIRKQIEKAEDEEPVEFAAEETATEIYED
jgi:DNA polymerase-3 subunit gamma/tau